jgi:predicted RNA methylase
MNSILTAATASWHATYSPEDNKLRLYCGRVEQTLFERLRSNGFIRAFKQGCFVAPAWTPEREDLLLELCNAIDDEDTSLEDRAETRAERFDTYAEHRHEDAERARAHVASIADCIPLGQPILVGHHSEAHARRDAERIQNGMRKAVNMWETSQYWLRRAEGARHHADYKARPDVRHRRIRGLEADLRRVIASYTPDANTAPQVWDGQTHLWCGQGRGGHWVKQSHLGDIQARAQRWERHYRNRIAYERALLEEGGGLAADAFQLEKGGRVLVRGAWLCVLKVNQKAGRIVSVTTNDRFVRVKGIEEIQDYRSPTPQEIEQTRKATKRPPLVNYRGEGFLEMTYADWQRCERAQSGYAQRQAQTPEHASHRQRVTYRGGQLKRVFLTDRKLIERPPGGESPAVLPPIQLDPQIPLESSRPTVEVDNAFEDLRKQLQSGGVRALAVPQLFPTPPTLAHRMVQIAGGALLAGKRILEPSAGTGVLLEAVWNACLGADCVRTVAVEVNPDLCILLEERRTRRVDAHPDSHSILCADFTGCGDELGRFDAILMNPPFSDRQDIQHLTHALNYLKPGARLVAIMSAGLTFRTDQLTSHLRSWIQQHGGTIEPLPPDTFMESGTGVNTVLVTVDG